jgi:ribosome-binding protein aMBF1 (putative translation factor)
MNHLRNEQSPKTNVLAKGRFDDAIREAVDRSREMQVEYERNELAMRFARIVRRLREERQLTQSDLASEVDVPQSFISRLENPRAGKEPSMSTLSKVMGAFGYKVVVGFERSQSPPEVSVDVELRERADFV